MHVFVTGGTGLIGVRLVRALRNRGDDVVRYDLIAELAPDAALSVICGGEDDGCVLQAGMPGQTCAARESGVFSDGAAGASGGVQALQAVQTTGRHASAGTGAAIVGVGRTETGTRERARFARNGHRAIHGTATVPRDVQDDVLAVAALAPAG